MKELPLIERTLMAAKTYTAIQFYFAHWQDVAHDFDLEAEFTSLMEMALNTPDRFQYGLEMMRFISRLNNSHSMYIDPYMREATPKQAYKLKYWHDEWVVVESYIDELTPGDIITHLDNRSIQDWFDEIRPVMSASSRSIAIELLTRYLTWFIPAQYNVMLLDGRTVAIDHAQAMPPKAAEEQETTGKWLEADQIGYIRIPSFALDHFQQKALEYIEQFKDADSIIFDVRENTGGATPVKLVKALMTEPYCYWMEGTPINFGLMRHRIEEFDTLENPSDMLRGYYEAFRDFFKHPMMVWDAPLEQPEKPIYKGKVFLLVGSTVGSAAEDFVVPFKTSGRGTLIGQQTHGSTGQPYVLRFDNGIMIIIGTKRAYFPDGSRYEGVGIAPDIEIIPTAEDLRAGRDPVLEKAVEMSRQD